MRACGSILSPSITAARCGSPGAAGLSGNIFVYIRRWLRNFRKKEGWQGTAPGAASPSRAEAEPLRSHDPGLRQVGTCQTVPEEMPGTFANAKREPPQMGERRSAHLTGSTCLSQCGFHWAWLPPLGNHMNSAAGTCRQENSFHFYLRLPQLRQVCPVWRGNVMLCPGPGQLGVSQPRTEVHWGAPKTVGTHSHRGPQRWGALSCCSWQAWLKKDYAPV